MSFFTDLFGDEGERAAIYSGMFDQSRQDLMSGYSEFQQYLTQAYDMLLGETGGQRYRQDYMAGIDALDSAITSARSFMSESFAQQQQYLEQGYEASSSRVREQFEQARAQTEARQAFTGLSQTSFAQSQLAGLEAGEGQALGMIQERRAENLSALMGQQAAMQSQFDLNAGGALMQARAGLAAGSFGTTTAASNLLAQIGQAGMQTYGQIAQFRFDQGQLRARNVGSGFNLGGALIGTGLGIVGNMFAPGIGGAIGGAAGGAAGGS